MKKIFVCLFLTIVALQAFSQTTAQSYQAIDAGFSAGKGFSSAFSYIKMGSPVNVMLYLSLS